MINTLEDCCLLGCDALSVGELLVLWSNHLLLSSGKKKILPCTLKGEAAVSSEMLVTNYVVLHPRI
jgi:hypothetical protein